MSATNYFDTGNFSPYANYIEKSFFPTWHNRSVAGPFSIIPNQYSYKIETKLTDARYGNFYTNQQKNEPNEYVSGKYYLTSFFVKPLYSHSEGGATYSLIGIRDSQDIYDFVLAFDLRNKTFSHRLYNNFMPPFETGAAYKEYQDGWIRVLFSIEYNGTKAEHLIILRASHIHIY
jgi:hypothetical protein